jgi:hexokinase
LDFQTNINSLRAIPEIGAEGEKRIRIGIAKDGSGVGAALIALVAGRTFEGKGQAQK